MLVSQIILVAGGSTVGLVERQLSVISGIWLQTNQHVFASISQQGSPQICCHMTSSNSVSLKN
jgi:hypothetical protein